MYNIYAIVILILFDIPLLFCKFSTPISSRCCTKIPEVNVDVGKVRLVQVDVQRFGVVTQGSSNYFGRRLSVIDDRVHALVLVERGLYATEIFERDPSELFLGFPSLSSYVSCSVFAPVPTDVRRILDAWPGTGRDTGCR